MDPGGGTDREPELLVVDDDRTFLEVATEALRRHGLSVVGVESAEAALERVEDGPVDCVVSDYDMPGRDGLELLEAVREREPTLPFVLYTAQGDEAVASDAISAGVTDYLRKEGTGEQFALLANRVHNAVERERSRREAERTRRRFRRLTEGSSDAVFLLDREGTYEYVSPAVEQVLGFEPAELEGTGAFELVHPDDRPEARDAFDELLEYGDEVTSMECRARNAEGDWLVLEGRGRNLLDDPDVGAIVVNARDVTERVERERALRELHEVATDLETCETVEAVCERVVAAAENVLEYDACVVTVEEDGLLEPAAVVSSLGPAEFEPMPVEEGVMGETYRSGRARVFEDVRAVEHAAPRAPCRAAVSVPVGDHGVLQAAAEERGFFDEADLELAELLAAHAAGALTRIESAERIREQRDRFAALFESVPEPIVHAGVDETGPTVRTVNTAFEETFGYDAEQLAGEPLDEFVLPPECEEESARLAERAMAGERVDAELRRETVDGERAFRFLLVPLEAADGATECIGVYADITEQKRRIAELERQNERLEEFAGIVSHDLRNPLNVATGRLELLAAEYDSEHVPKIQAALERMNALIDDVLALARQGRTVDEPERVDLAGAVDAAWRSTAGAVGGAELSIEGDLGTVEGDRERLCALFENLFSNAVEHGSTSPRTESGDAAGRGATGPGTGSGDPGERADPAVTVRVGRTGGGFYVADDGPGLPEDGDRVFEHGFTTQEDGTGFGLAIVEEIARAHGWDVEATRSDAGGARFEFSGVR